MPDYKSITDTSLPGKPNKKRGRPKAQRDGSGNPIRKPKEEKSLYSCTCCGKPYDTQEKNFITTSSPLYLANNGYYPVCRECLAKYYLNVVLPSVDGDEQRAVEVICGLCDWYYCDELLELAGKITDGYRENGNKTPIAITYGQRRNMTQFKKRGTTYLDTVKQRWNAAKVVQSHDEIIDQNDPNHRREDISEEDVWFFGPGYTAGQYKYLREQYEDWCLRYDCQSKAQEEIFKTLAIAQLNVQTSQQEGNQKKTTEAIRTLQDLMDTAKIKPKQKDDAALVEQNTFGTLIKKWEDEEPIPEPLDEWKDVDNIKHYITAWFFGHLASMFHLDNDSAHEYEEEIRKNTVERPQRISEEDSSMDSGFMEQFNAMRNKSSVHKDDPGGDDA